MLFRSLFTGLLRKAAESRLREAVAQAAGGVKMPAEDARPEAEAKPPRCHVGIVFALSIESGAFEDRLSGLITTRANGLLVRQGGLAGRGVAVMLCGVGPQAAARGAAALIAGHRPQWVISAGFAGGLDARVRRGDILMPDTLCGVRGERLAIDFKLEPEAAAATPRLHVGGLVSVDRIIRRPVEKRALGEQTGALGVDMESLAVAEVCRSEGQRFLAVRVISDAVDDELPADVEALIEKKTLARRLGRAAGSIIRRPSSLKDLWKLREDALVGAARMARFLEGIVRQLPNCPP